MTVFGAIISHNYLWSQYRQRVGLAKTQGPMMVGIVWVANVLTFYGYYIYTKLVAYKGRDPEYLYRLMHEWLQAFKLSFVIGAIFIFLLSYFLYRIKGVYNNIIVELLSKNEEKQIRVAQLGRNYFYGSLFVLVIAYLVLAWLFIKWGFWDAFQLDTN
jgi:hypothetical protein